MDEPATYHDGMSALQDRYDTRRLADRLDERLGRTAFSEDDRAFIAARTTFFLATADALGRPDCSYKGGVAGFVRVTGEREIAFPSYDGNGMFRSLGNITANPAVGLLFIDFESPRRLRVNGLASIADDDPSLAQLPGAQLVVRVRAQKIFPNCPRYIHRANAAEISPYAPREGHAPPEPKWKSMDFVVDVLPRGGAAGGTPAQPPSDANPWPRLAFARRRGGVQALRDRPQRKLRHTPRQSTFARTQEKVREDLRHRSAALEVDEARQGPDRARH
ncbi:MAG: pyridoxamine 5'-phosphate oxidase family protein [Aquincola sp.]|nr:pyridoxamine 5'-phosphate oxidase family protein [Aquincola sp.]MDH4289887.1 pyridoxamine 5'-phosphate oxidase family protein [Aquincola sp.]